MRILILLAALAIAPAHALSDFELFENMEAVDEVMRGFGLVPQIIQTIDVLDTGLRQTDVVQLPTEVHGKITLSSVGSYKPLTNLVTDIEITGTNVTLDLGGRTIVGTIDISGSVVVVKNGAVLAPTPLNVELANKPAVRVQDGAQSVLLKHFHVECYDSSLTGTVYELVMTDTVEETYSLIGTGTVMDNVPGRTAIEVLGKVVSLFDCSISSGSAAHSTDADAADGGHAIVVGGNANKVRLRDCIMITGNGGDSSSGAASNGGSGIQIKETANHIELDDCTVFETGAGGDGSTAGGNGGNGIQIASTAIDIGVRGCRIRNTGAGGSPGGLGGKAIVDAVTTAGAYSIVFRNFAHNIANTIKFDLRGTGTEEGIASPNPPNGTSLNPFANVYVP